MQLVGMFLGFGGCGRGDIFGGWKKSGGWESGGWKPRLQGRNPPARVGKSAQADLVFVGAISNRLRLWRLEEIRRLEIATTGAKPAHQGLGKSAQADLVFVGAISNRLRLWRLEEVRRLGIWRLETATTGAKPACAGWVSVGAISHRLRLWRLEGRSP